MSTRSWEKRTEGPLEGGSLRGIGETVPLLKEE